MEWKAQQWCGAALQQLIELAGVVTSLAHVSACAPRAGAKLERDQVPGVKLKTENKTPIVGLAAHPSGAAGAGWQQLCGMLVRRSESLLGAQQVWQASMTCN